MEAKLRRTMTSVTDALFPVSRSSKDPQQHQILKAGNDYVTNLPLQMSIFFNCFFSPFWLTAVLVIFELKYDNLSTLYRITYFAVYLMYTIIEVTRLYLGYVGNLMERVPELAGFWLLTLLLQLPLIVLLLFYTEAMPLPLERTMHIIEGLFIVFEVICGYVAIRHMTNYQVTKFHLRQFTDIEEMTDEDYWLESRDEGHEHYS